MPPPLLPRLLRNGQAWADLPTGRTRTAATLLTELCLSSPTLPTPFCLPPQSSAVVAVVWNWVWEPMLFVTIGWSINFDTLDAGTIPK